MVGNEEAVAPPVGDDKRRERRKEQAAAVENPYAVATEGMKRCPNCGFGNLVTDATCTSCGKKLPG